MMSGKATLGDAVQATRLGAFHFIEKPLTPEAVLLTVQGALKSAEPGTFPEPSGRNWGPKPSWWAALRPSIGFGS